MIQRSRFQRETAEGLHLQAVTAGHIPRGSLVLKPFSGNSPVAVKKSGSGGQSAAPPKGIDYGRLAREVVNYIQEHFEDVGPRFATEALKIHYGVAEKRDIRGSATTEEENTLKQEGVDFIKMPVPDKDEEPGN